MFFLTSCLCFSMIRPKILNQNTELRNSLVQFWRYQNDNEPLELISDELNSVLVNRQIINLNAIVTSFVSLCYALRVVVLCTIFVS